MANPPQALEEAQPQANWEFAAAVQRVRAKPALAIGLVLIAANLWLKATLLGKSFFRLDDYLYLERAAHSGLTWSYLTWVDAGHLDIVGSAVAWVVARAFPVDWTMATIVTLVLLACTCFALLRMLRTLFGDRPGVLLILVLYMLSPLALPGLYWWTVALEQLPLQLAIFCAVTAHVHYLRTRRFRHAVAAAAWLVVAMLSTFEGAATMFLLFALTTAFFLPGPWFRALWPALRTHWRAWVLYAALTAAYVPLYLARLTTSTLGAGKPPDLNDVLSYAGTLVRQTFVPGSFGGPWRWGAYGVTAITTPPPALTVMSWVLAVVVVAVSLMYAWRAWRAWAILVGWFIVVDIVPVLAGRSSLIPGVVLGVSARYVWDATGILALCLGLAFLPIAGAPAASRSPRRLSRPEFAVATTIITAVVFGSLWSFNAYPIDKGAAPARGFVATARVAVASAPRGTVIVDAPVPSYVTDGQYVGPVGLTSSVLSPMLSGPAGTRPSFVVDPSGTYDHLMEFNGYGQLVPSLIYGIASQPVPAAAKGCWPASYDTVNVSLKSVATGVSMLRIGYLAPRPGQVLIHFGSYWARYDLQQGLHPLFVPVHGATAGTVVIQSFSGAMPCIGDVQAGVLLPSSTGPAIPAAGVSG